MKNYKQLIFLFTLFSLIGFSSVGQIIKPDRAREAQKNIKKRVKALKKEGWGTLPTVVLDMQTQLEKGYNKAMEEDEEGIPKWIVADAIVYGQTYGAAVTDARNLARGFIAGDIQADFTSLIEGKVANQQLSMNEAASLQKTVSASKTLIEQKLTSPLRFTEFIRYDKGKKWKSDAIDVSFTYGYNRELARKMALEIIKNELKKESSELGDEVQTIFDAKKSDN